LAKISYTAEQQAVIDLRHANLIVSAAAGSGKTAVLTERILSLLTDGEERAEIDRMLIVTFTKAAAAEMRERIGRAIEAYCADHPGDVHMERQGTLLYNAQITTIDSFCLWVVRNHFSQIDLDPGFRILDEAEKALLFKDVTEELLEDEFREKRPDFLHLCECYCPDAKTDALIGMISTLYEYAMSHPWPEKWLKEAAAGEAEEGGPEARAWYPCLRSDADRLIADLHRTAGRALQKAQAENGPSAYVPQAATLSALAEELEREPGHDRRVRILALTEIPALKGGKKKKEDVLLREQAKELLGQCKKILQELQGYYGQDSETFARLQEKIAGNVSALVRLTLSLSERFSAAKRERNALDFSDMEHFALRILLKEENGVPVPTEAAKEYREYFACVCVDEYQDSNYVQEYILKSVAREDNYFCVGDIKQSIYRFRLARPEIFLKNYESSGDTGIDRRIDLNRNFRSRREVIDFINAVFSQIMRKDTAGMEYDEKARLYPGADYPEAEEGLYGAELLTLRATEGIPEGVLAEDPEEDGEETEENDGTGTGKKLTKRELECWLAADRIRRMVREKMPVWDRKKNAYRPVRYRDVAILARSTKGYADPVKKIFSEYGIPVYAGAQSGYFGNREIRLIMNVLRVIDNPMQDVPLYDVLTGYLKLFTEESIAALRAKKTQGSLYRLLKAAAEEGDAEARDSALRFFAWQEEKSAKAKYVTVRELLEELLTDRGFLSAVTALPGGIRRRENLKLLLEKASDYEKTSYRGLYSFIRYVERIREAGIEQGEAELLDENADVVRLMTIHKSKGLEFPVVICMGLSGRFETRSKAPSCRMDSEYGIALDAIDTKARIRQAGLKKMLLAGKEKAEELAENMRVLYVALTRAMEKLILTDVIVKDRTEGIPEADRYSILHASSMMDWIRMALAAGNCPGYRGVCCDISDLSENILADTARATVSLKALYEGGIPADEELAGLLEAARERVYSHEELRGLYTKTSVSELKRAAYEDEEAKEVFVQKEREEYIPGYVRKTEEGYAGAKRGSAFHRFLELLDFASLPAGASAGAANLPAGGEEEWLKSQAAGFVKSGRLTAEESSLLIFPKLLPFIKGKTAGRMRDAARSGRLRREQPFFIGVSASRMDPSFPPSETILIQGVIDAYWEEDEELILLDYKTDRVDTPEELEKRYRTQLQIYAEALTQLTGKRVREALICSFALERTITVQIDIPV